MKHWWVIPMMILCSCHHKDKIEPAPRYQEAQRVVVVYMMAENSLSFPYSNNDLNEIRSAVKSIPDSCRLVVYFDNSNSTEKPQLLSFTAKDGEELIHQYDIDPISTDSTTMQDVLGLITYRCPAKSYGLVMWSHGSGWIPRKTAPQKTIGIDNGRNNTSSNEGGEMEISTLANVLRNTGEQWDYVFFDACFMQGVEVAYELRDVVPWCIGSPAEIPGNGAPYDEIMNALFLPTEEVWRIAEDYYNYYEYTDGLVISAIRTNQLDVLAEATAPLLSRLDEYPETDNIQKYLDGYSRMPNYHDMGSAIGKWFTEEEYATWRRAVELAVPHHYATTRWLTSYSYFHFNPTITDPDHIVCMSMYIPSKDANLNDSFRQTKWYKVSGWKL